MLDWHGLSFTYSVAWQKWHPYLTSHQQMWRPAVPSRQNGFACKTLFCILPICTSTSFCVIFHGLVMCGEKKKKSFLPRREVKCSHRNVMPAPTSAAELLDVMKGRRWRLMPLRSKERRSMKEKVCTIKAEITLDRWWWEHIVWKYILADKFQSF